MKKLIYAFALVGLFTFAAPIVANACYHLTLPCGPSVYCCYPGDEIAWYQIYCERPSPCPDII